MYNVLGMYWYIPWITHPCSHESHSLRRDLPGTKHSQPQPLTVHCKACSNTKHSLYQQHKRITNKQLINHEYYYYNDLWAMHLAVNLELCQVITRNILCIFYSLSKASIDSEENDRKIRKQISKNTNTREFLTSLPSVFECFTSLNPSPL